MENWGHVANKTARDFLEDRFPIIRDERVSKIILREILEVMADEQCQDAGNEWVSEELFWERQDYLDFAHDAYVRGKMGACRQAIRNFYLI